MKLLNILGSFLTRQAILPVKERIMTYSSGGGGGGPRLVAVSGISKSNYEIARETFITNVMTPAEARANLFAQDEEVDIVAFQEKLYEAAKEDETHRYDGPVKYLSLETPRCPYCKVKYSGNEKTCTHCGAAV